jgi:hypothetical protein
MALGGAVIIGGISAVVVPYMSMAMSEGFQHAIMAGTVHFSIGPNSVLWSWPTFCVVTLLSWMLLKSTE